MAQDSLVKGVGRLIGTATELGAALAGAVDKATAGGRELPPAPPGETPTAALIRHSVSAVANVTRQVVDAAQSARSATPEEHPEADARTGHATASAQATAGPEVHQGATLRVPLSVENPGRETLRGLEPSVAQWSRDGRDTAAPGAARVLPERLDIEPRDFEKLTVYVDVGADATPGGYRLDVELGQGAQVAIDFRVITADTDPANAD
jgi:hypothetical protein